jgi:predicted dehydrogenase
MLAENYPYTQFHMEMRRLYRSGEIGTAMYGEGEYNHPMSPEEFNGISPGIGHWRNWLPSTYYCTHALAPLMYISDGMPVKVNGLSIANPEMNRKTARVGDPGSVILCRMDNGAVFRLMGLFLPGHSCWTRVHGTRGAMETTRDPGYFGSGKVRVWHEPWLRHAGQPIERVYVPEWPEHAAMANRAGHGGGDFWTNFEFANAIRSGKQPYLNVYRGVAMSSVGILAWRSALSDGAPCEMPNFSSEKSRKAVENDHWSPFPSHGAPGQPPPSILGVIKPKPSDVAQAQKIWKKKSR